jgi:two-component system, LytTR family, response regulator
MTSLRVMIVDDEELAREGLVELLRTQPGVVVVGAYPDGLAALRALDEAKPDVLCVDIRMPGMDGVELVRAIAGPDSPAVIFVTAYDAFAIQAFELNAIDYLLKPVTSERLAQAIQRVQTREMARRSDVRERLETALEQLETRQPQGVGRLIVREVGEIIIVATRDIDWIEGADYYSRLHVGPKSYLFRESLSSLEKRLDNARFLRIHRSSIVNLTRVRAVRSDGRGDGTVVLSTGANLRITGSRRAALEKALENLHEV